MNIDMPLPSQREALRNLWKQAFGDTDADIAVFMAAAFSPERCRCVSADGELAAALYWFDCLLRGRKIAYLYAVATAKEYRGQGICRRLMEDTHRHLETRGYSGAVLVPGSGELFAFYDRMGYRTCSRIREFCCAAAGSAAEMRRIGTEEYAHLRRQFLPEGGVVQEGENLALLQTQAELYAGDGYLLTARRAGNTLSGTELLGDISAAPDILRALECTEGYFRCPGEGRDFAMYLPLSGDAPEPPAYFGLAFD